MGFLKTVIKVSKQIDRENKRLQKLAEKAQAKSLKESFTLSKRIEKEAAIKLKTENQNNRTKAKLRQEKFSKVHIRLKLDELLDWNNFGL